MEFDQELKLGVFGCGSMGEAIVKGVLEAGVVYSANLYLYDIALDKSSYLKERLNVNVTNSSEELVNSCNTILLAVKPQDVGDLLKEVSHLIDPSKLVISIAAGVSIKSIKNILSKKVRVARVMPNIGALENHSVSALCHDDQSMPEDKELSKRIFKSIGDVIEVEEHHMDAVTAVSGSGPAYFFYVTEMLEEAAVAMGIDEDRARQLAVKTAIASAVLLRDSGYNAGSLRKRVTSKGGTTEAAFSVFAKKKLHDIFLQGVKAAKERSRELSGGE